MGLLSPIYIVMLFIALASLCLGLIPRLHFDLSRKDYPCQIRKLSMERCLKTLPLWLGCPFAADVVLSIANTMGKRFKRSCLKAGLGSAKNAELASLQLINHKPKQYEVPRNTLSFKHSIGILTATQRSLYTSIACILTGATVYLDPRY